jgi:hypothetical protein
MKHFINILVLLILTFFAIGLAYLQVNYGENWYVAFVPLCIFMLLWGIKLFDDYE